MKRWRTAILLLIVAGVAAYILHRASEKRAQEKREGFYQAELRSYSDVLKPGMSRRQVEDYLRSKGKSFQHMCCIDRNKTDGWDDLVRIGQEDPPWVCTAQNVYVGFLFRPDQQTSDLTGSRDTLTKLEIFRRLEGCL